MTGHAPTIEVKLLPEVRVAIVSSSWHLGICNDLIAGAQRALSAAQVARTEVFFVPGSFEIPLASQYALERGVDAGIALGLVLKGETPHFDYVCQGVTQGIMDVSLKYGKPVGYGVLMCNSLDQAIDRCGRANSSEDKGFDSAIAVLELLHLQGSM